MALKTGLTDRTKMTLSVAALKDRITTGPWRNPVVIAIDILYKNPVINNSLLEAHADRAEGEFTEIHETLMRRVTSAGS